MKIFRSSVVAALILMAGVIATLSPPAKANPPEDVPGNPLFYGEWYTEWFYENRARGETKSDLVTVQMKPGEAITRHGAQITLKREFEIIRDFGDTLIVAMTTSQPRTTRRTRFVGALELVWNNKGGPEETFRGRRSAILYFRQCYAEGHKKFSKKVLAMNGPEERWDRIMKFIDKEMAYGMLINEQLRIWEPCAINAEGQLIGAYSVIEYYRFLSVEEQRLVDAGELDIVHLLPEPGE